MNLPEDAIKERGEIDPDTCPDCWHDVEDCVCPPESLRDDGRSFGDGESYAERNL